MPTGWDTPAEQLRREQLRLEAAFGLSAVMGSARSRVTCGHRRVGAAVASGLADGGPEALRSKGPVSPEKLSPQQWARLELELRKARWRTGSPGISAGRWAGSRR